MPFWLDPVDVIVPELVRPPETVAEMRSMARIPEIWPALTTAPPIELVLMVRPTGPGLIVEVLVTLLVTVALVMLQLGFGIVLVTSGTLPVTGALQSTANAAGVAAPISSAASDVDASSGRSLARPLPYAAARADDVAASNAAATAVVVNKCVPIAPPPP